MTGSTTMSPAKRVKQRLSDAQIAAGLRKCGGLLHPAAAALGVARRTLQRRLANSPALREVQAEVIETALDMAEASLIRAVEKGEAWAVCFYLKCKGKGRGYTERQEVTGASGGPVQVSVPEAELDKIIAGR